MNACFDLEKIKSLFVYDPQAPFIFSRGRFLFLFFAFSLIYVLLKRADKWRILYVLLFSYYFYYKSSGVYFVFLFFVSLMDFLLAHKIYQTPGKNKRKFLVFLSLLGNLGLLVYFKYTNFFYEIICDLSKHPFDPLHIFLPVGISFFTFQSLSYSIDVYRGQLKPLSKFTDYAFYVSFFPQLVAGPIVRAKDFVPQINRPLWVSKEMFGRGVFLIVTGLFKKAVISDYISVNFVDRIFDNPTLYSGIENLFGIYGYALQIYCDFSGYSDMAIGIALLLGFHFNVNFDSPYKSATITEFWRRWHISLSSWLKDYLYISLGGNRKGKWRTYLNLFITMLLGGLWHGASLRFICWGALHGIALAVHKFFMAVFPSMKSTGEKMKLFSRVLGIIFTFHIVCFGWIFFRADSFHSAIDMMKQIITSFHPELFTGLVAGYTGVFALMGLGFLLHFAPDKWEKACQEYVTSMPLLIKAIAIVVVIVIVIQVKSSEIQPFIYFQF